MNARAMNVEQVGDLGRGVSVGAEQERLQAQGNAWGFVGLRLLAQCQELAARAGVGLGKDGLHSGICCITIARIVRQGRPASK